MLKKKLNNGQELRHVNLKSEYHVTSVGQRCQLSYETVRQQTHVSPISP